MNLEEAISIPNGIAESKLVDVVNLEALFRHEGNPHIYAFIHGSMGWTSNDNHLQQSDWETKSLMEPNKTQPGQ